MANIGLFQARAAPISIHIFAVTLPPRITIMARHSASASQIASSVFSPCASESTAKGVKSLRRKLSAISPAIFRSDVRYERNTSQTTLAVSIMFSSAGLIPLIISGIRSASTWHRIGVIRFDWREPQAAPTSIITQVRWTESGVRITTNSSAWRIAAAISSGMLSPP